MRDCADFLGFCVGEITIGSCHLEQRADEIDAFLDDDNVDRVAQLVLESSSDVQQIVITHRDIMMSHATLLYGVSMTSGISNIISMKLKEAESLIKEVAA